MGFRFFYLLAGMIGLPGLALIWYARRVGRLAAQSLSWPAVTGRIQQSGVTSRTDQEGNLTYQTSATYDYAVGGVSYQSSRIAFGATFGTREYCEQKAREYAPGTAVQVYYNPGQPGSAVLERTATTSGRIRKVGTVMTGLGVLSAILAVAGTVWLE